MHALALNARGRKSILKAAPGDEISISGIAIGKRYAAMTLRERERRVIEPLHKDVRGSNVCAAECKAQHRNILCILCFSRSISCRARPYGSMNRRGI